MVLNPKRWGRLGEDIPGGRTVAKGLGHVQSVLRIQLALNLGRVQEGIKQLGQESQVGTAGSLTAWTARLQGARKVREQGRDTV